MEFKRPDCAGFPQVYRSFTAKEEEFYVSDLTEVHEAAALDLLVEYVIPEENFCKALQIHKKEKALEIMIARYRLLIKNRMSLACFKKATNELVGLNILSVSSKIAPKIEIVDDDPDRRKLHESRKYTDKLEETFEKFQVDHILEANGLGVKTEYRGRGIAVELLKARVQLMQVLGLTVTLTCFSTLSSQKAAAKAGYTEISSISFEELQRKLPDFDFSQATGKHCKNFIYEIAK